ncbi:MAG: ABC transporter substrate-binding protein, partial [Candidatus Bathyarchaeia archaeon]
MSWKIFVVLSMVVIVGLALTAAYLATSNIQSQKKNIRLAVEFVDHAACAFVARRKGLFEANGLNITAFECYITGPALSAAIAREDIDAAYMCLVPAICAYANARVPIKIVVGIHKYGYALVVDPNRVNTVKDLEKPDIRIACTQKGTSNEVLLRKMIEKYGLNEEIILGKIRYMNPPLALLSLRMGQIDAAFLPEQYPTMAEELG